MITTFLEQNSVTSDSSASPPQMPRSKRVHNVLLWSWLLLYIAVSVVVILHHEPWRDEADVWLAARNRSFFEMCARTGYVGFPFLWHALVMVLAKPGLPYISMYWLNLSFATGAAALILFRSPFPLALRLLIPFGYLPFYEYGIIARPYALNFLLVGALASLHSVRKSRPIYYCAVIAVLANVGVLSLAIAVSIAFALAVECRHKLRQYAVPLLIALGGIVAATIQVISPPDCFVAPGLASKINRYTPFSTLRSAFFPDPGQINHGKKATILLPGHFQQVFTILALLCLVALILRIRKNKFALTTLICTYLMLWSVFTFKYLGSVRHWGFLLIGALYCVWITLDQPGKHRGDMAKLGNFLYTVLLCSAVYSAGVGVWAINEGLRLPFSDAKEAGEFISTLPAQIPVAVTDPNITEAVLLDCQRTTFYSPLLQRYVAEMPWTIQMKDKITDEDFFSDLDRQFGVSKPLILLSPTVCPDAEKNGFQLLYCSRIKPLTADEEFFIYGRNVPAQIVSVSRETKRGQSLLSARVPMSLPWLR